MKHNNNTTALDWKNGVGFRHFYDNPPCNLMVNGLAMRKSNIDTAQENNDDTSKRIDISIDCYRKLNRAANVSLFLSGDLIKREINGLHQLYVPDILSYIGEDVQAALSELKENGVFDVFIQQEQLSKP
ncbi:derepression protein [Yersinia pekkanenii]|uniref:Uncharacterized protein n=1 Tax=Yersinia pekkanenii TaxID=1288385 RepID=A0A0T9R608_9GAMM|nr:hypothetical protein [Yersinia pekkanenii]CNI46586.1 Uncharacterised protein [Yersinia pekkanenii]CRY65747.1 Uncharacterised protein [Yersinia pekkanenii]